MGAPVPARLGPNEWSQVTGERPRIAHNDTHRSERIHQRPVAVRTSKGATEPAFRGSRPNPGSELVVLRLDRLGRSTRELLAVIEQLANRQCSCQTVDSSLSYRHGGVTEKLVISVLKKPPPRIAGSALVARATD